MTAGIYEIRNLVNDKVYIGSAVNLIKRKCNHLSDLRLGISRHPYLQNAWNKYGEANFEFRPLMICVPDDLILYEQRFLDVRQPFKNTEQGYNCWKQAESNLGGKWPDKQYKNFRKARLGVPTAKRSAETRRRMSDGAKNRPPISDETRRRLSESHKGQTAWHKGKKCPQLAKSRATVYPAFINLLTKEIIPTGYNLAAMCRERNLSAPHFGQLRRGELRHHKGWVLLKYAKDLVVYKTPNTIRILRSLDAKA